MDATTLNIKDYIPSVHNLSDTWTIYSHLPYNNDWTVDSYQTVFKTDILEQFIVFSELLSDVIIKKCMLFIMKNDIQPMWEDDDNKNGGCFSYKIQNENVVSVWKNLSYKLIGNSLLKPGTVNTISGITISPKRNFCIIKIWLQNCKHKDSSIITNIEHMTSQQCIFKKHIN